MNINALARRLDKLATDGDAERYQTLCDKLCDEQGWPRMDMCGATSIEHLLEMLRDDEAKPTA